MAAALQPAAPPAASPRRRKRFWLIIGGTAVVIVAVVAYGTGDGSRADYERALPLLAHQPQQCEALAQRAVHKAWGDFPEAQLLQCRALAALGEWEAALGGLSLIRDTTPCAPEALVDLGIQALATDHLQLAERAVQAARVPGPTLARATELLVRIKLKLQLPVEALALCREWQVVAPTAALPWVIAAETEASQFELAKAIADYRTALRRAPSTDLEQRIHTSLANLLVHTGDVAGARLQFDQLLQFGPLTGNAQLDYAQLLRLEGRYNEALAEVNRYVATTESSPEALKRRGQLQLDLGQLDAAAADLQAAVVGNDLDIGAHHLLAQIYLRQGKTDLAQPHLAESRRLIGETFRESESSGDDEQRGGPR